MLVYVAVIFITGAATLALELLASRVMTPYFGVSLYIWTGILSITLISLAFGYFFGGRLASGAARFADYPVRLRWMFFGMPAFSSISIGIACLVYPWSFFQLAQTSLVAGAFIACLILLLVPLVTLSAMNPLLIALRSSNEGKAVIGDSGSGMVFFISTVGSVVGVWITAFWFIPNLTNFTSILLLGILLALISLIASLTTDFHGSARKGVLTGVAVAGLALSGGLLAVSGALLGKNEDVVFNDATWTLKKEYMSLFGNTKIFIRDRNSLTPGPDDQAIIYYQDGIVQNVTDREGQSLAVFSYALEGLAMGFLQEGDRALVLGLGAGLVPARLTARGIAVDVVEINPDSFRAAAEFFDFDATSVGAYQLDARGFVKRCPEPYAAIIVDLFTGDGVPEYLLTRNFFSDLNRCLQPDGVVVINAFTVPQYFDVSYHVFKTLNSVFQRLLVFHDDFVAREDPINLYIVATNREHLGNFRISAGIVPAHLHASLQRIFARPRPLDQDLLVQATVITDEYNIFPILNLDILMAYRRKALAVIPPVYLVN